MNTVEFLNMLEEAQNLVALDPAPDTVEAARLLHLTERIEFYERKLDVEMCATMAFGDKATARAWLSKRSMVLGMTPYEKSKTDAGVKEVKKILSALSYGGVI